MRIVHLTKNELQGGAARAAYRLHKGLRSCGHESIVLTASRTSDAPSIIAFAPPTDLLSRVRRGLRQYSMARAFRHYRSSRPSGYELFSDDRGEYTSTLQMQIPACDVLNLHWVPGFLDYATFFAQVPHSIPLVWTLHDMNPFTGGCHYNLGCGHYIDGCGACPQLGSTCEKDLSSRVWHRKKRIFSMVCSSRLHITSPSRWLADEVKRSPILGKFPVSVIPYGLSVTDFAPRNRDSIRGLLGIPKEARVVLFVAERTENRRKGIALLMESLARCARLVPNLTLLSVGQGEPRMDAQIPAVHLGALDNDRFLSMVYSAADVFAICSLQDNLPNTVLEAMACGVPTVGVAVGGIPDMVRDGVNGLTVRAGNAEAFAAAVVDLLNNAAKREQMKNVCRRVAVEEYSLEVQAQRYVELYSSLVQA